jgi:hypothetical protein
LAVKTGICGDSPRAWVDFPDHEVLRACKESKSRLAHISKELRERYASFKAACMLKWIEYKLLKKKKTTAVSVNGKIAMVGYVSSVGFHIPQT